MMYLYESHMGGTYLSNDLYDYDELYCETCGDSDYLIGEFETIKEYLTLVNEYSSEELCTYLSEHVERIVDTFGCVIAVPDIKTPENCYRGIVSMNSDKILNTKHI